jgi:hypothetical protein
MPLPEACVGKGLVESPGGWPSRVVSRPGGLTGGRPCGLAVPAVLWSMRNKWHWSLAHGRSRPGPFLARASQVSTGADGFCLETALTHPRSRYS